MSDQPRRMFLSAFTISSPGHQSMGMWKLPGDKSHEYKSLKYWTDLAKRLDRGGFDTLFVADVLGIYDVYQDSPDPALKNAAQVPILDPVPAIAAMASVTENLGFGVTVALTYEQPYSFARRMSTLDHLTDGRIAWNIVTSYLDSAARNMNLDGQIPHDERYDIADEFMDVCYQLWERSWDDDAVVRDAEAGMYTDPSKVRGIEHKGKYFTVPGMALCEPSPQRTPVLFQAGASSRGQEFAAKHAEMIFLISGDTTTLRRSVDKIRAQAEEVGRGREDVRVLAGVTVVVAETDAEAQALYKQYKEAGSWDGGLVLFGGWSGVDLGALPSYEPLDHADSNSIRSAADMFGGAGKSWTAEQLGKYIAVGGATPVIVGSPQTVADELERWMDEGDIDGFQFASVHMPYTYESITELVVPELRRRGRVPEERTGGTLREKLGFKSPLLQGHPAEVARTS
ncbi:LLM class flavin-dependent oxidoreductase [Arthrobacter sp. I2-34]|uniref:LLM class flavin-dependent oxidoreductase n=1 Tax=Arthrobacter hankyongi TaxID=2904801 RepID=A0ABS9L7Z0_9MICC|nr:LLM class flavin-dependent oxidoreductase [Arthrobacter hankyongi]MCG2622612.1 LLM class flavin-dependent oxidoreductase [Arthrobacter hankyongi]